MSLESTAAQPSARPRPATGPHLDSAIDRLDWSAVDPADFRSRYLLAGRPVVVSGAFDHWPAARRWRLEHLRERWGDHRVQMRGIDSTLGAIIEAALASTPERPAPYLHNYPLHRLPAEAQAEIGDMPACSRPNWLASWPMRLLGDLTHTELYIGGAGARFPTLHYDGAHTHAFLMQLEGIKEYVAFAPDQTPYLYPRTGTLLRNRSSIDTVDEPDLTRFPEFARARGVRFQLHPGETLFIPSGWWHTVKILTPSITVSINGANRANWSDYRLDYPLHYSDGRRWKGQVALAWLSVVGLLMSLDP